MKVELTEAEDDEVFPPRCELHVRVLTREPLEGSMKLPASVLAEIDSRQLVGYSTTAVAFYGDLREDDDPSLGEWPHEQWWALAHVGDKR